MPELAECIMIARVRVLVRVGERVLVLVRVLVRVRKWRNGEKKFGDSTCAFVYEKRIMIRGHPKKSVL